MIVAIYTDTGVAPLGLAKLLGTLSQSPAILEVIETTAETIFATLDQKPDLLIMPGGRDIPYHQALKGEKNNAIKEFVNNGGGYLGICAGAYYGASHIIFDEHTPLEIKADRELGFYPGTAKGPAYGEGLFDYTSEKGARIARIRWLDDPSENTTLSCYFNGGCYFLDPENYPNTTVLASYDDLPDTPAAIISCEIGEGLAILSGIHPEFDKMIDGQTIPYFDPDLLWNLLARLKRKPTLAKITNIATR